MAQGFVQVAPDSTGAKLHTREYVVGANTVDDQYVIPTSPRTRTGLYRASTASLAPVAAPDGATAGRWWLINPVGSSVAVAVKRLSIQWSAGAAVAAVTTQPRVTIERMTFTGTASGAQITPARRVRTAVAGQTADATPVATLRTASTGMTITAGELMKGFYAPLATGTALGIIVPTAPDDMDPDVEDSEVVLAAGEGIVCRQADAGTASDWRRWLNNLTWEEFTAP